MEWVFGEHTVTLHNLQELDDDLGGRSDKNLTLTTLLSVGKDLKAVSEGVDEHHSLCFFVFWGWAMKPATTRRPLFSHVFGLQMRKLW
jgi:hypothetical protein